MWGWDVFVMVTEFLRWTFFLTTDTQEEKKKKSERKWFHSTTWKSTYSCGGCNDNCNHGDINGYWTRKGEC